MSRSDQWHSYVPETNMEKNEERAGPWEQPLWIYQKETLPDQYAYNPCWDDWLCGQGRGSG